MSTTFVPGTDSENISACLFCSDKIILRSKGMDLSIDHEKIQCEPSKLLTPLGFWQAVANHVIDSMLRNKS